MLPPKVWGFPWKPNAVSAVTMRHLRWIKWYPRQASEAMDAIPPELDFTSIVSKTSALDFFPSKCQKSTLMASFQHPDSARRAISILQMRTWRLTKAE